MQRDPKRIKRILSLINSVWKESPDLRLLQLLEIVIKTSKKEAPRTGGRDRFYYEDDLLEESLLNHKAQNNRKKTSKIENPEL
jgi:uncharacterized protein YihD (DUF1040 family)